MKRRTVVGDLGGERLRSGDWERERDWRPNFLILMISMISVKKILLVRLCSVLVS